MGELINLNPQGGIPDEIARDTEVIAAINAHLTAGDPHPGYLTQTEGDGRYRQTATPLTDADIPAAIARDTEVIAAINAHLTAGDPHPGYLTQTEGDGRYRQTATPLTDADIPAAIARDSEVTTVIANIWGGSGTHYQYDSINFNNQSLPLGLIWIRAGVSVSNSFASAAESNGFLLNLRLGSDMSHGNSSDAHRLQIAFPFGSNIGQIWTRKLQQNVWSSWIRI